MKKTFLTVITILIFGSVCLGEDLVPATSEDLMDFDRQVLQTKAVKPEVAEKRQDTVHRKQGTNNFGQTVSAEAKKLKEARIELRAGGRANKDHMGSGTSGTASGNDAKKSAPAMNNSGNGKSDSAPGRTGNHK